MTQYEFSPGLAASAGYRWPEGSRLEREAGRPTLVMLAHPRCPCTRASIGELEKLMARCGSRVAAWVLFYKPRDFPADWEMTDMWRAAAEIPGVSVLCDLDGEEAARFGAKTSGQTLLYGSDGRRLFLGGITASRGHSGDNAGREAIVSLVTRDFAEQVETPVFGCSIRGIGSAEDRGTQPKSARTHPSSTPSRSFVEGSDRGNPVRPALFPKTIHGRAPCRLFAGLGEAASNAIQP